MAYKWLLIPIDSANEEIKVARFQHNGQDVYVPLGTLTKVPSWVIDLNDHIKVYEQKAPVGTETEKRPEKKSK